MTETVARPQRRGRPPEPRATVTARNKRRGRQSEQDALDDMIDRLDDDDAPGDRDGEVDGYAVKARDARAAGRGPRPRRVAVQISLTVAAITKLDNMAGLLTRSQVVEQLVMEADKDKLGSRE